MKGRIRISDMTSAQLEQFSTSEEKKIIVTGGRDFKDKKTFKRVMSILKVTSIIEGGAKGADKMAQEFREKNKLSGYTEHAQWQHGNAAGNIRNEKMLSDNPDAIVVAFPGNSGTAHCVRTARELGMLVIRIMQTR